MSNDDAYIELILLRNQFLSNRPESRFAIWYYGTCYFQSHPKLNQEFDGWMKEQGIDFINLRSKAIHKESREWVLEDRVRSMAKCA